MIPLAEHDAPSQRPFFIRRESIVSAPLQSADLIQAAKAGKLSPEDEVARSFDGPWIPAAKIEKLRPFLTDQPQPTKRRRYSNPEDRLIRIAGAVVFVCFTLFLLLDNARSVPAESDLQTVMAKPDTATVTRIEGKSDGSVEFSIGGWSLDLSQRVQGYRDLISALRSREELTVGFTQRKLLWLIPVRGGSVWKVAVDGETIVGYEAVKAREIQARALRFVVFGMLFVISLGTLTYSIRAPMSTIG